MCTLLTMSLLSGFLDFYERGLLLEMIAETVCNEDHKSGHLKAVSQGNKEAFVLLN